MKQLPLYLFLICSAAVPPLRAQVTAGAPPAEAIKSSAAAAGADVTYEQILANPDDPALNYAYARAQVLKGDLKGAAGTLERMLLVDPDLHTMRLFYAVVLYRLDSLSEAEREFAAVAAAKVPAPAKEDANAYLKAIKRRQKTWSFSGGLSAGAEYDSNRNASPDSQKRLFLDTPLTLTGSSRRTDDTSFLLIGNGELRRPVGAGKKNEIFGSFSYFRADQSEVKAVNLQALTYRLGGAIKHGRYALTPSLSRTRVLLDRENFMVNKGGSLRLETKLNKTTELWTELDCVYQDSLATSAVASNPERRGQLYTFSAGAGRVLNPVMKLNADLAYSSKLAAEDYYTYSGAALNLRHSWLLGKGRFLLSSASLGNDVYKKADAAISRKTRKEAVLRAGVTAGAPVASFGRKLAGLKGLTLTLALEYLRSNSTVLNYTYENFKAAALLGYRWDAGF